MRLSGLLLLNVAVAVFLSSTCAADDSVDSSTKKHAKHVKEKRMKPDQKRLPRMVPAIPVKEKKSEKEFKNKNKAENGREKSKPERVTHDKTNRMRSITFEATGEKVMLMKLYGSAKRELKNMNVVGWGVASEKSEQNFVGKIQGPAHEVYKWKGMMDEHTGDDFHVKYIDEREVLILDYEDFEMRKSLKYPKKIKPALKKKENVKKKPQPKSQKNQPPKPQQKRPQKEVLPESSIHDKTGRLRSISFEVSGPTPELKKLYQQGKKEGRKLKLVGWFAPTKIPTLKGKIQGRADLVYHWKDLMQNASTSLTVEYRSEHEPFLLDFDQLQLLTSDLSYKAIKF